MARPVTSRPLIPALCLIACLALAAGLPVAGGVLAAPATGQAAVLFAPGLSAADLTRAAARAGVDIVRFGGAPGALIVNLDHRDRHADLRAAGAWLIADPAILGACARLPDEDARP